MPEGFEENDLNNIDSLDVEEELDEKKLNSSELEDDDEVFDIDAEENLPEQNKTDDEEDSF